MKYYTTVLTKEQKSRLDKELNILLSLNKQKWKN